MNIGALSEIPNKALQSKWISNPIRLFALLCALWLSALLLYAIFSPLPRLGTSISEEPLAKLSPLMLGAGERYVYVFSGDGGETPAGIGVAISRGCGGLLLYDQSLSKSPDAADAYSVCVSRDGAQLSKNGTKIGGNLSYEGISWPYFSPWMLAVKENWSWGANTSVFAEGVGEISTARIRLRAVGETEYGGRKAWDVRVSSSAKSGAESEISRLLIDEEKRILLYSQSGNRTVRLTKAPFPLNFSG